MTFIAENLGPITSAEIELGDLTIVCGRNNNGKTYLTYTLAALLSTIKRNIVLPISDDIVDELIGTGELQLNLLDYVDLYIEAVNGMLPRFKDTLPRFLAMHPDKFIDTTIKVNISRKEILSRLLLPKDNNDESVIKITENASVKFTRNGGSPYVTVLLQNKASTIPSRKAISDAVDFMMAREFDEVPLSPIFPDVYTITCERTGAMLFRNELIKIRERAYEVQSKRTPYTSYSGYQKPVFDELNFILDLPRIQGERSAVQENHPEILALLARISGGIYKIESESNQVRFSPTERPDVLLSLQESSSTVRSLAELYFYIMHKARPGQLLILDEPELNLHPENQRLMARLLTMMSNVGIRVFITTHSDYIVREINALVRLNNVPADKREVVINRYGISPASIIKDDETKIYVLHSGVMEKVFFNFIYRAFAVPSFDNTIEEYNHLYNDIRYLDFHD